MDDLTELLKYVRANYPPYAFVVKPGAEVAVDGLIFRLGADGGLLFVSESGEQVVTLEEALQILTDDASSA